MIGSSFGSEVCCLYTAAAEAGRSESGIHDAASSRVWSSHRMGSGNHLLQGTRHATDKNSPVGEDCPQVEDVYKFDLDTAVGRKLDLYPLCNGSIDARQSGAKNHENIFGIEQFEVEKLGKTIKNQDPPDVIKLTSQQKSHAAIGNSSKQGGKQFKDASTAGRSQL